MRLLRRPHILLLSTALTIGVIGAAGCSDSKKDVKADSTTEKTTDTTGKAAEPLSGDQTVEIKNYKFAPDALTVKVGTKVTWKNEDNFDHTATSDGAAPTTFDTGKLKTGTSADVTFDKAGDYKYQCSIHSYMKGTVDVVK